MRNSQDGQWLRLLLEEVPAIDPKYVQDVGKRFFERLEKIVEAMRGEGGLFNT